MVDDGETVQVRVGETGRNTARAPITDVSGPANHILRFRLMHHDFGDPASKAVHWYCYKH
jgi:hypothetical protein